MRTGQWFRCLFWAALYCVLYLVSASDEDLVDFDFTDLKEIDWNYDNENDMSTVGDKKLHSNLVTFDAQDDDDMEKNQVHPFDWREKVLRTALSKALTNVALRQKFVEVMPILRVLSSQQRLALSALISAQINAKKGQELKLEQVRMMFGDDKKLLIPLVYDIANLVRNSARKYIQMDYPVEPSSLVKLQMPADRRQVKLTSAEAIEEEAMIGVISSSSDDGSLEDFLVDMPDDVLDPQSINEELQSSAVSATAKSSTATSTTTTTEAPNRSKRAIATPSEFVHKLVRSVPLSVNEDELLRGDAGRTFKLNTTAFTGAKEREIFAEPTTSSTTPASVIVITAERDPLSYQEIEDLAFASLNGSEVHLGNADATSSDTEHKAHDELLPSPEELIAGPRYRFGGGGGNKLHQQQRPAKVATAKRKRVQVRPRPKGPPQSTAGPKKCERFTASMCIRSDDYPLDQIMGSIRRHKNAMSALLAEYHDKPPTNLDLDDFEDFSYQKRRREDEATGGSMCQSIVRFARPQKARSASGEWKYIVNTGQHTQTLRLEKCTNPQESCSYLAQNYRSHCAQIYNYHRLLSWDKTRGLHVDIFKVPTCCSCQIDGYRQQYPPFDTVNPKEYTPAYNAPDSYSTINEELDYNDDEADEEDAFGYQKHHKHEHGGYDADELLLSSKKVRTKAYPPVPAAPTVGAYLSPPDDSDEYDARYSRKKQRASISSAGSSTSAASNNLISYYTHRRPHKNDRDRVDLEIAPSEPHSDKEVNLFGPHNTAHAVASDKIARLPQKRKRISYSVPYTATAAVTTTATAAVAASIPAIIPASSVATNAHQKPTAAANSPAYYTPSHAHNFFNGRSKTRFHAFTPTTGETVAPTSSSSTTESARRTSALPPSYHVNSIYSAKYNASAVGLSSTASGIGGGGGPKRINYSYHPIIDFFENNRRSAAAAAVSEAAFNSSSSTTSDDSSDQPNAASSAFSESIYPHKIPKYQARERRIGFGAGGASVAEDNAWHPVVVES